MASKDVTSFFGSIRFVLPLISIFFIAAGSVIACPKHTGKASHRTKSINTRTVSYMTPVVITYGGRCSDRRAKRVMQRDAGYYEGDTRYVAPRTKLVEVRHFDDGYVRPTYVNVQRVPVVDDYFDRVDRRKTVAVRYARNGCARVVTCGERFANVGTKSSRLYRDDLASANEVRHVVVKSDYIDGTEKVIYSSGSDESAYVDIDHDYVPTDHVTYVSPSSQYSRVAYVMDKQAVNPCTPVEPTEPCSGAIARTVSYAPAAYGYDEFEDQGDVAYAPDDPAVACLPRAFIDTSPAYERSRVVSYASIDHADDPYFIEEGSASFEANDPAHPLIRNGSSVHFVGGDDLDATYIAADADAICPDEIAVHTCEDDMGFDTVSHIPIDEIEYIDTSTVRYEPVENVEVDYLDNASDECEVVFTSSGGEPVSYADDSLVLASEDDVDLTSGYIMDTAPENDVSYAEFSNDGSMPLDAYSEEVGF